MDDSNSPVRRSGQQADPVNARLSDELVDDALELAGAGKFCREFRGYAGAGPLVVSLYSDEHAEAEGVHIGWSGGGMYLTPFGARQLARWLEELAGRCSP